MAKFYIQSGNVSFVVSAQDVEGAALWAMHRTIEKVVDQYEQRGDDCPLMPMLDGLAMFDEEILCSQRGFGREDAAVLDTDSVFRQWKQLMHAADRLFDQLK